MPMKKHYIMLGKHLQQEVTFLSQNTNGYGDDTEGQILQTQWREKNRHRSGFWEKNRHF